jgi:opacity protein-like surface antigen
MASHLQTLYAACVFIGAAGAASAAGAADSGYIGADYGMARYGGRAYVGYALGREPVFDTETTHYLELMGYSLGYYGEPYANYGQSAFRDFVRVNGVAINWATSTRISDKWSANTRVGVNVIHAKTYGAEGEQVRTWDNVSGLAGAGLAYAVDRHWTIRADVNYMPLKVRGNASPRTNGVTTGLDYKF